MNKEQLKEKAKHIWQTQLDKVNFCLIVAVISFLIYDHNFYFSFSSNNLNTAQPTANVSDNNATNTDGSSNSNPAIQMRIRMIDLVKSGFKMGDKIVEANGKEFNSHEDALGYIFSGAVKPPIDIKVKTPQGLAKKLRISN